MAARGMVRQAHLTPSLLSANAKVADFIDADSGWWNVYLLDRVFLSFEAQKIKFIPLCLAPREDTLIWPKSKDGQYSMKLDYQLLCARESSGSASGSTNEVNRKMWLRRKVVLSNSCTSCNREPKSVIHALWGCEKVKVAWGTNFDELRIATNQALSFVDLFRLVLQNPRGAKGFIMVCWFIWNRRNEIRLNEAVAPLEKTSDLAQKYLVDFQQQRAKSTSKKLSRKVIWKPPDTGLLKTNFDGPVFEDLGAVGIGIMVRNSSSEALAALFEIIPLPSSIVVLETIAARRAILFTRELGCSGSIMEGDSEEAILAIKNQSFQHLLVGHLVNDIQVDNAMSCLSTCSSTASEIVFSCFSLDELHSFKYL
ncbi:hypothetical protein RGQ29_007499 [Quercus rubra]|uniref:RNase H type-1 domain-containing protein n=1 Tax=Quercus rubra TaxID=3512 RepID=A0AAN7I7D7_QUERU|nr:hypothetical protein RGQ29_007499 [Quercus rubra]